ncbi:hypothetical protein ID866_3097 [Astraeus odoratus]|nr:hypothetical protein ID866_3097 [Astraeus odoratus]
MFPSKSLFGILLVSTIANASPFHSGITKVPVTRIQAPRRAKALYNNQFGKRHDETIIAGYNDEFYTIRISTSSTSIYKLIVDIGNPYTWVGNNPDNPYVPGSASRATGPRVKIYYDDDTITFTGMTHSDIITLEDALVINPQSIGVSDRSEVLDIPGDFDGLLGLGPTASTTQISEDGNPIPPIPTVLDSLHSQGTISDAVLGVYFMPHYDGDGGELSFGNYDDTVLASGVNYVPITNTRPASYYWGVDGSVRYRGNTILGPTSGIIDSGNTLIRIARDAFASYISDTGATLNPDGWYSLTRDQYNNLGTLTFVIGGQDYGLSPNAQIFPRASPDEDIFLVIDEQRTPNIAFWRYYVVLNASSSQVGFALTFYTYSTSN